MLFPSGYTAHLSPSLLFSFALNFPVSNSFYASISQIWFQHIGIQLQIPWLLAPVSCVPAALAVYVS